MQKNLFLILCIGLFLYSCSNDKPHILYVKFEHDIEKYRFDGNVFQDDKIIGEITNVKSIDSVVFYEITFKRKDLKLRKGSVIELKSVDLLGPKKLMVIRGNQTDFYQYGDTLLGRIAEVNINSTSQNVDSVIKNIDPAIKELLQLDTNGKSK
jgi:hypothetical protein